MNSDISVAEAVINGSEKYPMIKGYAYFSKEENGTSLSIALSGLLVSQDKCKYGIFASHIHEGGSCSGNSNDSFADTKVHYNPNNCLHPFPSGDMPSLFAVGDRSAIAFLTDRFTPAEIIGKTLVIHRSGDDLHSQPSGNSGEKLPVE